MSAETTEPRKRNAYQQRRDLITEAVGEMLGIGGDVSSSASVLEDALHDRRLQILPMADSYGQWLVLIDGQPAPYVGQDRPSGPMDADEAAEIFLVELAKREYNDPPDITIRPATDLELVGSVWSHITGAEPVVAPEPVRIAAHSVLMETDEEAGVALLRVLDRDGRQVMIGLDEQMYGALAFLLETDEEVAE